MSKDPLDMFNRIPSKIGQHMEREEDFPGTTSPRNRGKVLDRPQHEWLQSLKSSEFLVNGQVVAFYTIGALAQALNRKPVTVRSWEAKGWIPPASFRTPAPKGETVPGKAVKGRRLYSEAQLVFLVEAAITYNIDDPIAPDWKGFRKHIADNYPRH
jgi:hypothetical protein